MKGPYAPYAASLVHAFDGVRRAYSEFLTLPSLIIGLFVVLAIALDALDRHRFAELEPARSFVVAHIFTKPQRTQGLLATIASSIITMTSITISLLLIALQQSAGSLTARVFDQYLRRWYNQAFFGYFVGLSLYTLMILATVDPSFNPVFGGTLALIGMLFALCLLVVLLYSTINQTRPAVIIEAVHDLALAARERQRPLLRAMKRIPTCGSFAPTPVRTTEDGFITGIDVARMGAAARKHQVEVVLGVSIGSYVASGDIIAHLHPHNADATAIVDLTRAAIHVERQRDIRIDPAYAIEQLETIGWTSVSSAKHNPAAGVLVVENLRDILARWSASDAGVQPDAAAAPIFYVDNTLERLMDAFESLALVSSESKQHMVFAAIARAFATSLERLGPSLRAQVEQSTLRMLAVLEEHAPTRELDCALTALSEALRRAGSAEAAADVEAAHARLDRSIGGRQPRSGGTSQES